MSMSISLSFFPSKGNTVKAFASVIRHLAPSAETHSVKRYRKSHGRDTEKLDLETLMSILESPKSESLADSRDALYVDLGRYTLASGELAPLTIQFHGRGYESGVTAKNDSSLRISIDDSGLWRMMKSISRDMSWTGLDAPEHLKAEAIEKANRDSELLFLKACGFSLKQEEDSQSWNWDYEENYIDHGAMYYESGWSRPLRCQMVYHRDPQEFAKDFERIYADYHWGVSMPLLYGLKKDIWQLSESEIHSLNTYQLSENHSASRRCGKQYPGDYKFFSRPIEYAPEQTEMDAVNFVESLDKQKVQQLSKLPVSYIKEVFSAVAETELPEVRFHDFGEQGAVLIGAANLSVWRAYRYLAELASDYIDSE